MFLRPERAEFREGFAEHLSRPTVGRFAFRSYWPAAIRRLTIIRLAAPASAFFHVSVPSFGLRTTHVQPRVTTV
jgi:hypothetical protein